VCAPNKANQWLVGYFLDNELEWYGKDYRPDGLFREAWKLSKDRPARKTWMEFVQKEFADISGFNSAYGTSFKDFAALADDTTPHLAVTGTGIACGKKWVRQVAETYFKACVEAIRRHDPNHLVLGCRFAGQAPDIWDIAGKYCDVVSFNIYPRIDVERGVPEPVLKQVNEWGKAAARPMMVTEWSFPALDAGLPSRHGAGMRVDTQEQRAKCFGHFQDFLFRLPFIVGSCYFMYLDEPALGISSTFPEDSNYGLVSGNDEPYPTITSVAARLNPLAKEHHEQGGFRPFLQKRQLPRRWMVDPSTKNAMTSNLPMKMTITSGRTSLEGPAGGRGWKMNLDGKPVAELFPLIHQNDGLDFWVQPGTARIVSVLKDEFTQVVDMEFTRTEGDVPADMKPESARPDQRPFRAVMRYWIPNDFGWVASQCLTVQNTSRRAWRLRGIFHYMIPLAAGDGAKIELISDVPNYYRPAHAWVDCVAGRGAGCWFLDDGNLKCHYWKGDDGSFHSDLWEEMDVELKPGETHKASPDPAFFFPLSEATLKAHADACARIEREIAE
jgi:hypothetical protein